MVSWPRSSSRSSVQRAVSADLGEFPRRNVYAALEAPVGFPGNVDDIGQRAWGHGRERQHKCNARGRVAPEAGVVCYQCFVRLISVSVRCLMGLPSGRFGVGRCKGRSR